MKIVKSLSIFALAIAFSALAGAGPVSCPAFQHDNGAGACEFNNYLDSPGFLSNQNQVVAASLNADPSGPAAAFARQYYALPINQQMAVMNCQLQIFNVQYFHLPAPQGCPLSNANGQLDVAQLIANNPAPANPGNAPNVNWDGSKFAAVVPPQPGPAVPIVVPPPPPASGNVCGAFAFSDGVTTTYYSGPGAMNDSTSPARPDGSKVNQAGLNFTFHVVRALMGIQAFCTIP